MIVLKHGKLKSRKFTCNSCGCEFVAKVTEYSTYESDGNILWCYINCPECGNETTNSEPWEEQNDTERN